VLLSSKILCNHLSVFAVDIVFIGNILRPHGLNGMVIARAYSEVPRNLKPGVRVWFDPEHSEHPYVTVKSVVPYKTDYRIAFREITDRTQAEQLVKKHFGVPRESLERLAENEFYVFDLIGCCVSTAFGEFQGEVEDVISNPGNDLLKVNNKNNLFLIPMVKEIIKSIDLKKREIIIEPIDGLNDIN